MQERDVIEVFADGRARRRREYSLAYKRRLVALAMEPGSSVSKIAQQHGLNTNLLFTWRRIPAYAPKALPAAPTPKLLPVTIVAPEAPRSPVVTVTKPAAAYIEVEIGLARMRLHGAVDLETVGGVLRLLEHGR